MSTLREDVLPIVDVGRQIIDDLGFRVFTVEIVTRTWSGGKVNAGTTSDSAETIFPRPKVVEKEGGKKLLIGPVTPAYVAGSGGGYAPEDLRPPDAGGVQMFWRVTGPFASGYARVVGSIVDIDTSKPLRYMVTLAIRDREAPI
jgi:hypothetical protein